MRLGRMDSRLARVERDVTIDPGSNVVNMPLRIVNPKRWYPAGYGAQDMYTFKSRYPR